MAIIIQFPTPTNTPPLFDDTALSPLQTLLYHPAFWRCVNELDCQKVGGQKSVAYWIQADFMPSRQQLKNNPRLYQSIVRLLSLRLSNTGSF